MNEFIVKFADLKLKIKTRFDYMHEFCKDYLIDDDCYDLEIEVSDQDIIDMKQTLVFSDEYSESLAIYEQIANKIVDFDALVMHGACIKYLDYGLLFTAPSGTGKTTHIKLWKQVFGDDVDIVNGDKPIVRIINDQIRVYGTPYSGKENWHKNQDVALKAICFIKQGKQNHIKRLSASEALIPMYSQLYLPKSNKEHGLKAIALFDYLLKHVAIYELSCDISSEAVMVSYKGMIEDE